MEPKTLTYQHNNQHFIGKIFYPNNCHQHTPAIILFHPFEGCAEFVIDYAKRLAEKGFIAFATDMFGDGKTADTIDGCFDLLKPIMSDTQLIRDRANAALKTLLQQPHVDAKKIHAIGFCFGGKCALELARSGAAIKSCVSLHGVIKKSELPTHDIQCKILILHGYEDPQVPPSHLADFAIEMKTENVADWTVTFFGKAQHSFTDSKTGTFDAAREKEMGRAYDANAAKRSFEFLLAFVNE